MADPTYVPGQQVKVFSTPFVAAQAQHLGAPHAYRPATIVRQMPEVSEGIHYEIAYTDGQVVEGAPCIVEPNLLVAAVA